MCPFKCIYLSLWKCASMLKHISICYVVRKFCNFFHYCLTWLNLVCTFVKDQKRFICCILFPKAQNFFKEKKHYKARLLPSLLTLNFSIRTFLVSQNNRVCCLRDCYRFWASFVVLYGASGQWMSSAARLSRYPSPSPSLPLKGSWTQTEAQKPVA